LPSGRSVRYVFGVCGGEIGLIQAFFCSFGAYHHSVFGQGFCRGFPISSLVGTGRGAEPAAAAERDRHNTSVTPLLPSASGR
jgi:hypothetical protein